MISHPIDPVALARELAALMRDGPPRRGLTASLLLL